MSSQPQASSSQPTAAPSPAPTTKRARGKTADGGAATGAKRPRKGKAKVGTPAPETPTTTAAQSPVTNTSQLQWAEATATASQIASALSTDQGQSGQDQADGQIQGLVLPAGASAGPREGSVKAPGQEEDDEEALPEMAEDDYSAQLSWQSQSKDNLKVLMDNFTPEQYDRFEAYRRHALPKQAVRKVVQQGLGHQVSTPVAQIVAGFSKVFVGEIIEKAREVQQRRGDTGPLSPDHLREAYHIYQVETGRVGAARPLKSKQLFRR